jgi:hypothetical protein
MQRADQPGQRDQDVVPGSSCRERLARDVTGNIGQHFPALLVDAERDGRGGEADLVQVGEVSLDRAGEGPDRAPDRVADPDDAGGDAISDQRLPAVLGVAAVRAGQVFSRVGG